MKAQIFIDNLKCGGCANTITKAIKELEGIVAVKVDKDMDLVEIEMADDFNIDVAKNKLKSLGYPEKDSVHGIEKLTTGAKSFVSCAIGRMNKTELNTAD